MRKQYFVANYLLGEWQSMQMTVMSVGLFLNSKYIKMGCEEGDIQAFLTQPPLVNREFKIEHYGWMATVGRAGEVWFLSMVDWIEYEPFGAKKKEQASCYGWITYRQSSCEKCHFMNFVKPLSATSFHFCPASLDPLLYRYGSRNQTSFTKV